jgi:hypothetical protein
MTDIAPSFDEAPSKDGGAMPELRFDDLIPAKRAPPSLFETMWHQALDSVRPSYLDLVSSPTAAPSVVLPEAPPEHGAQTTQPSQNARSLSDPGTGTAAPTQTTDDEKLRAPSSEPGELRFDDPVPQDVGPAFRPGAGVAWLPRSLSPLFGTGHNSDQPITPPTFGMGHNGGPPLEDAWWKLLVSRTGAPGALLGAIWPTSLNRGDAEYVASRFAKPYGQLKGKLPQDFQAHHLNQNAAFRDVIAIDDGIAVGMHGNALTEPGTAHYDFHQSMETFWNPYRLGGDLHGRSPTNAMYGEALQRALQAGGLSSEEASYLAGRAAEQRAKYGIMESAAVPRVPSRMNQARTAEERLQDRLRESEPLPNDPRRIDRAKTK